MPRFPVLSPVFTAHPPGGFMSAPAPISPELHLPAATTLSLSSLFDPSSKHPAVDPTLFSFLLLLGIFSFFLVRILIQHLRDRAAAASNPCDPEAAGGLGHQVLATSPVLPYAAAAAEGFGTDCAVCLEEFGEEDRVRVLNACRHTFHCDCIDAWLVEHFTCPICRADLEAAAARMP